MADLYDAATYAQLAHTKELIDALEQRSSAVREQIAAANASKRAAICEVEQLSEEQLKAEREKHAKLRKATEDAQQAVWDLEKRVWSKTDSIGKEHRERISSMEYELAKLSDDKHVICLAAPKLRHLKLQGSPIGNKQLVQ